MQVKRTVLALLLTSALPIAACYTDDIPTSPTQAVATVSEAPPAAPTPAAPPAIDTRPIVTITGPIANLARSGEGNLDARFRIDDFTIVRVSRTTPVSVAGGRTGDTNFLREGQTVIATGPRASGFLDATRVEIIKDAPPGH